MRYKVLLLPIYLLVFSFFPASSEHPPPHVPPLPPPVPPFPQRSFVLPSSQSPSSSFPLSPPLSLDTGRGYKNTDNNDNIENGDTDRTSAGNHQHHKKGKRKDITSPCYRCAECAGVELRETKHQVPIDDYFRLYNVSLYDASTGERRDRNSMIAELPYLPPERYIRSTKPVIFIHIQKTGGMSLRRWWDKMPHIKFCSESRIYSWSHLRKSLDPERGNVFELRAAMRSTANSIWGNCTKAEPYAYEWPSVIQLGHSRAFGLDTLLPPGGHFFTIFRDPVARLISFYHFIRRDKNQPLHAKLKDVSLSEFIFHHHSNHLSSSYLLNITDTNQIRRPITQLYSASLMNLRRFKVIGIQEYYEESMLLLEYSFGWTGLSRTTLSENRRKKAPKIDKMTSDYICHLNHYDCILYQHALDLFKSQIMRMAYCCDKFYQELVKMQSILLRDIHFQRRNPIFTRERYEDP